MSKSNFFKFAAMLMLVVNVLLITFILTAGPPNRGGHLKSPKSLNLDEDQEVQFTKLVNVHMTKMEGLNARQKDLILPIFLKLNGENSNLESEEAFELLEGVEAEKVRATYAHFLDVKKMLRPEQYDGFDLFVKRALQRILYGGKNVEMHNKEIEEK